MAFDSHSNFGYGLVLSAPSPALSGTSLTLQAGQGALMPTAPFNATVWPVAAQPTASTAEIVRVTAVTGDTLTIARTQEGSSARAIVVGDQFAATVTKKTLTDIESAVSAAAPLASPTFTGTPAAPTPAVDDNSTKVATTAFVLGQTSATAPAMDGTAAAGTSTRYARADHVHPSDTSRVATSQLGVASGVATLDAGSTLTASQVPASVVRGTSSGSAITSAGTVANPVEILDPTGGTFTRTLPTPVGANGVSRWLKAVNTNTNYVTVATAAGTIDGAATITVGPPASGATYQAVQLVSDGTIWRVF